MAILLGAHHLRKGYGARPLFDDISLVVESGERIGLIGPNGAGKSTLLRILAGVISPDSGERSQARGLRIGFLEQTPALADGETVEATVLSGTSDPHDPECLAWAQEIMARLELSAGAGGSAAAHHVTPERPVGELSGGWKKRVALARELAKKPDLLLLDEPTNHLDVESIAWLENFLARAAFATMTITHDRLFLQRVANRILELDRRNEGGLLSVRGDYATYLDVKAERMANQEQREERLRNRLRRETEWLRRGAKARTTKQQARIGRAEELKTEVQELEFRNQGRVASLEFQGVGKSPHRLIEAKGITRARGGRTLFRNLSLLITPQSRTGLLGPNGCGKSTLIRTLLGEETPDLGTVFRSDRLVPAYFEQSRESLDPDVTVAQTLAPRGESVTYRGVLTHVKSYLGRFLFRAEQMDMKVGRLSGGEQSRLVIARLMLREANLLVLDEPTNDLDTATLDVLEDCLADFPGAVLLVTHDRYFLDQVASEIVAFDPRPDHEGELITFAGLAQWETWRESLPRAGADTKPAPREPARRSKKLGYKEQRELDGMEDAIGRAETRVAELQTALAAPENASNGAKLASLYQELSDAQAALDKLYERWAELERMKEG